MNIYKTAKSIPKMLTMSLVGGDISRDNFDEIVENMKIAFSEKIKVDNPRGDYCWMVQFEGIFDSVLNPTQQKTNNKQQNQSNQPKTPPKISFEIIEEEKKNQQSQPQNPPVNTNKKSQYKIGIKLVIESDCSRG